MGKIDELDRKILRLLQRDADISVEELGTQVGLSRNACWRRIKNLEDNGIISKTVALINPEAINLNLAAIVTVRATRHDSEWLKQFQSAVNTMPEIIGVYRTSGTIDYVLHARVRDMAAYDALYKRLISKVDLMDVSTSFVMEEVKHTTELPLDHADQS
ncbi:MAG: Lrp/AsnC family transcriptional regulator [Magnetovibrio sp.]|nr:Lrp/AsnC family transcriptional regulator [Magnetovibrio sp.]